LTGKFITLEGADGSGKSTITRLLDEHLQKTDIDFIITREPGGTEIGEEIRQILLDNNNTNMGPETEALLYAAARSQHIHERIQPSLEEGKVIICDRFLMSSLAYQGVGRDLGIDKVKTINDFGLRGIYPDLILFFHVDPKITLERKTTKSNGDRLENEGYIFHEKVYAGYMELLKLYPENVKIIDASKPLEEVFQDCVNEIGKLLNI